MGVIRNANSIANPFNTSIEDVLEDIIDDVLTQQELVHRRPKKIKHRSGKPHAVGEINSTVSKSGKKKKRIENSNYLLSLADPEEAKELSIYDFVPHSVSAFAQLLMEKENMEAWNDFINCTDNDEFLHFEATHQNKSQENRKLSVKAVESENATEDGRCNHPAFSADQCFQKIDSDLRCMLRKKHVPLGALAYLEKELTTFFEHRPQSIYQFQIPSSFERLLVHALCQYMDLTSLSYDRDGIRWTRVRNNYSKFYPPSILLSAYLEKRMQQIKFICQSNGF